MIGDADFLHNSSSDEEYSYNKFSGQGNLMGNYQSDLIWGNRHVMASGGSHTEEKTLVTNNYPGLLAGQKT